MILIDELRPNDVSQAVALLHSCWPDWEDCLRVANDEITASLIPHHPGAIAQQWFVAKIDDEVVGVASWCPAPFADDMYELCWAAVKEEYRHRGINTQLLDRRLAAIKQYHATLVDAEIGYNVMVRTWDNPMYATRGFIPGFKELIKHPEGKCILLATFGR